jgi:hypothetical protein
VVGWHSRSPRRQGSSSEKGKSQPPMPWIPRLRLEVRRFKVLQSPVFHFQSPAAIALPSQSILIDKSQAGPSTRRKQTLEELLSLLKHYSPGTRRGLPTWSRQLSWLLNTINRRACWTTRTLLRAPGNTGAVYCFCNTRLLAPDQ